MSFAYNLVSSFDQRCNKDRIQFAIVLIILLMKTKKESIKMSLPKKEYIPPKITAELELETRAGSPLGLPDSLDEPND